MSYFYDFATKRTSSSRCALIIPFNKWLLHCKKVLVRNMLIKFIIDSKLSVCV